MEVCIRTDASTEIGSGHVMRCLALAEELVCRGGHVTFLCRSLPGNYGDIINKKGFEVHWLSGESAEETIGALQDFKKVDWMIVDHYGLDRRWESQIRTSVRRLMVIDDLANRPHDCDVLLDQTYGEDGERYKDLVPLKCQGLFGLSYALLRKDFREERSRGQVNRNYMNPTIHVFFGGMDQKGFTIRYSRLLLEQFSSMRLLVVVGPRFENIAGLEVLQRQYPERLLWMENVDNMAREMGRCTVAFGSPGITTWERVCMGLPSIYLAINENQIEIIKGLSANGLCDYIGLAGEIDDGNVTQQVKVFFSDTQRLESIRRLSFGLVDGRGAERVVQKLFPNES